jgi:hypothetical protein
MQVHIFGLDHFHQSLETRCQIPAAVEDERLQKDGLRAVLEGIIVDNKVDLIAEEGEFDRPSLGNRLAEVYSLRHINLTMPMEERQRLGIVPQYEKNENTRRAAYTAFERYMFQQTDRTGARVVLVMIGRRHRAGLEQLFSATGHQVVAYDIYDYSWCRGIPQEGADGIMGYEREE